MYGWTHSSDSYFFNVLLEVVLDSFGMQSDRLSRETRPADAATQSMTNLF